MGGIQEKKRRVDDSNLPLQVMRELDRERAQLEKQEKKLVGDIRKMAKSGQMEAVKIMAKDLVRTRSFVKRFILMRANIQGIALKIQTLKSQAAMANAMKGARRMCVCVCVCRTLLGLFLSFSLPHTFPLYPSKICQFVPFSFYIPHFFFRSCLSVLYSSFLCVLCSGVVIY